jgi:pimeloyl-ACP methyl ester carboxylesterase
VHTDLIHQAADHLVSGDRVTARLLLEEALRLNPGDEQAWLWLSGAVETDSEQLDCLRQVLAIDPNNQAAQAGIRALSGDSQRGLDPAEASLESFLKEQEANFVISPGPTVKKVVNLTHPVRKGLKPALINQRADLAGVAKQPAYSMSELRSAGEARGMDWARPGLSLALPLSRERSFGLPGLLQGGSDLKKQLDKNLRKVLLLWNQIPFTSTQVTYFILGLIITFLLMLIGFSVLKTLVQGPRYKVGPPAVLPAPATPSPIPEPTPAIFKPALVPSDCRFNIPADIHVECVTAILPESRDGSSSRSIRIPLAIYRSLSPFPPPDPIIYLHSGGSAVEWTAENFESFILPLLYLRDVIVVEPRGGGQSTPNLDCTELNNQYYLDLKRDPEDSGRTGGFVSAVQACRDRLVSQGIRFSNFTTAAFAADIADIAALLEYEKINLYGVSYGSSVAQVVMRDYPHLVRSGVLDSALPLEVKAYNSIASSADYALHQFFETCAGNSACRSAYPNLEAVFNEVMTKLVATPVTVSSIGPGSATGIKMVIDGRRFQQAILQALYSNVLIPEIPKGIYSARYGDTAILEEALALPRLRFLDPSVGGVLSQNCLEQVLMTSPTEIGLDLVAFPNISAFARYSFFGSPEILFGICELWKAAPNEGENYVPLYSSTPTLILAGLLDPVTPAYFGEQLAAHLDTSSYVVFPGLGHAPSTAPGFECPLSLAVVFINDPTSDLDSTCGLELEVHFTGR